MTDSLEDPKYFTQAVVDLGQHQDVIASVAIFNTSGVKVVDKGALITRRMYERLIEHRLSVSIENSVMSSNVVTGDTLRESLHSILEQVPFFARLTTEDGVRKMMLNVIATVPLPQAMAFQLTVARDVRPELYLHLIRTALVAAWLARTPLSSRFDLGMAASAGLLHDIGMLHVDPVLYQPQQVLDRDQRRQLYSHPLVSAALLERLHQYPSDVVRAVGEHQEYMDGSGYPRNLSGDAISALGRIVALAQVVAAMFAPARNAPEMRLSVLLRMNTHRYDAAMAMQVVAQLQPQLDGTSAELALVDDPIGLLQEIHAILSQWPLDLGPDGAGVSAARQQALELVSEHAAGIVRDLAGVGAVPEQLAQLGDESLDQMVRTELTLIAQEACWQLRTLRREAYRRWQIEPEESYPPVFEQWMAAVDAMVAKVAALAPAAASHVAQAPALWSEAASGSAPESYGHGT